MQILTRDVCWFELSYAFQQKEKEREKIEEMKDEKYWVERAKSEFTAQFLGAVAEGRNPDYFEARVANIPGKGNILWEVAKYFIEGGFSLMLSNMEQQRILARNLNTFYPNFPDNILEENANYMLTISLRKTS